MGCDGLRMAGTQELEVGKSQELSLSSGDIGSSGGRKTRMVECGVLKSKLIRSVLRNRGMPLAKACER